MSNQLSFDVAVIGAGIGGYTAAIRSAQLGMKTVLIEKDQIGGVCLNWGCVPTKTLLATVHLFNHVKNSSEFGISVKEAAIDIKKIKSRKRIIIEQLRKGLQTLFKRNQIRLIEGEGHFISKNLIQVLKKDQTKEIIKTDNTIIATGSYQRDPPYAKIDDRTILSTKGALEMNELPNSLTLIGGKAIGTEFAIIYNGLGCEVIILEPGPYLLPSFDSDIRKIQSRIMRSKGIDAYVNVEIESVTKTMDGKVETRAFIENSPFSLKTEKMLITDMRYPRTENLGLVNLGVKIKDEHILVDEYLSTNISGIYAVGDVIGGMMLANSALAQGIIAAENIAGNTFPINQKNIPTCVYSQPEIACVGLTETEARNQGYNVETGIFPMRASGRARILNETTGMFKIVCNGDTGEIIGVHIIAPQAIDIIGEACLAISLECTIEELESSIHAHPSISEALMESARIISKKPIHI